MLKVEEHDLWFIHVYRTSLVENKVTWSIFVHFSVNSELDFLGVLMNWAKIKKWNESKLLEFWFIYMETVFFQSKFHYNILIFKHLTAVSANQAEVPSRSNSSTLWCLCVWSNREFGLSVLTLRGCRTTWTELSCLDLGVCLSFHAQRVSSHWLVTLFRSPCSFLLAC